MALRLSVAVGVMFFAAIGVVSLVRPRAGPGSPLRTRWDRQRVAAIATALVAAGVGLQAMSRANWAAVALDWLPGAYLLAGYWLPAQLGRRPAPRLQAWLESGDRRLFEAGFGRLLDRAPRPVLEYLEAAYLCCYVVVPAALAWLYHANRPGDADAFWTAVLLAALPCYALVAWFETVPPRSLEGQGSGRFGNVAVRRINLRVLGRASIGVNTFPSGHTAASLAAALAVGAVAPAAGAVLAVLALSIAVGSVAGRYHYALDAAFGVLVAVAAFAVSAVVRA